MDKFRVWYGDEPDYSYFQNLAQSLKHIRKTKKLDESNSGLEEKISGEWDEWMDMDDQEVHDHLYMYGATSPYLKKGGGVKQEPVRPSIMDTVSFSTTMIDHGDDDDDEEEENDEDHYDEIIEEEDVHDEEDLDERLMNVIGVSPKTTTETTTDEFVGEADGGDSEDDDDDEEDDDFDEDETED